MSIMVDHFQMCHLLNIYITGDFATTENYIFHSQSTFSNF